MKKILAIVMISAMTLTMAGCGSSTDTAAPAATEAATQAATEAAVEESTQEAAEAATEASEEKTQTKSSKKAVSYSVQYVAGEGGTVTRTKEYILDSDNAFARGSVAAADESHKFVNWTDEEGNEVSTEAEFIPEKPDKDETFTANFEAQ